MQIGRRVVHANWRTNSRDPYVSWQRRESVTDTASQAAGHRRRRSGSLRRERSDAPTGSVRSDSGGKIHGRGVRQHSALAVTRVVSLRSLGRKIDGRRLAWTILRVDVTIGASNEMRRRRGPRCDWQAAALRGAPCVVSGREARGRGNPARVRSARRPRALLTAARGARINHVVSMPLQAAPPAPAPPTTQPVLRYI